MGGVGLADMSTRLDSRFLSLRPRLLRLAGSLVGPYAAEDVVHDAYEVARRKVHQLRDPDALDGWLTRITVTTAYNHGKRTRLLERLIPRLSKTSPPARDLALRELVEALPATQRSVVVLHYGYGYRLDEIASMVGTSHTNVRTLIHRARQSLGRGLEGGRE